MVVTSWLVMMWAVGCGADTPAPRAPVVASVAALAVMEVELAPVRRSPLWHLVQRVVASQSLLAAGCPEVLDRAERATLGMEVDKEDDEAKTVFGTRCISTVWYAHGRRRIVHGDVR